MSRTKKYTVKSLYMHDGNRTFKFGEAVTSEMFAEGKFQQLIDQGFIAESSSDDDVIEDDDKVELFTFEREGEVVSVYSEEDINKDELLEYLKSKGIDHKSSDSKKTLFALIG